MFEDFFETVNEVQSLPQSKWQFPARSMPETGLPVMQLTAPSQEFVPQHGFQGLLSPFLKMKLWILTSSIREKWE
jgi:hypothetical protein